MAINTALLIEAPIFQSYLVDKDTGEAMAAGVISMYSDSGMTVYKNWYYQVGQGPTYTYVALPNPLTLSSIGTIVDGSGNNVQPLFYPYSESDNITPQPYYINVVNSNGEQQFTIYNFPLNPAPAQGQVVSNTSFVTNNVFWRNNGTQTVTNTSASSAPVILAPANHDGYVLGPTSIVNQIQYGGDWQYFKDTAGSVDTISFPKFSTGFTFPGSNPPPSPEFYMNFTCTSGSPGSETYKYIQTPIDLHLLNLQNTAAKFTCWARVNSGSNTVGVNLYAYAGTGSANSATYSQGNLTLTSAWTQFTLDFNFPDALTVSNAGDDAWYLQFSLPIGSSGPCNIDIALPSIFIGSSIVSNSYQTYDQVDSIISSPRTGDYRTSLNDFSPFGWVPCNDGVISNAGSFTLPTAVPSSRAAVDTWQLFNLLWNLGKNVDVGSSSNPIIQLYNSAGAATTYGATSYADWNSNKQLQLTYTLGRSLIGAPPSASVTFTYNAMPSWSGTTGYFTATTAAVPFLYVGAIVYLTGTMPGSGPYIANTPYYVIPSLDGSQPTQFQLASTPANAISGTSIGAGGSTNNGSGIVMNFSVAGSFGQSRHIQTANELAQHRHTSADGSFFVTQSGSAVYQGAANSGESQQFTANTGSSWPMTLIQPVAYANVFLKL